MMHHFLKRLLRFAPLLLLTPLAISQICTAFPAFSQTHYTITAFMRCTRDDQIVKAFALMQDGPAENSLDRIVQKPVRVIFKDMKMVHKALKNYDALSWLSNQGEQVIFINEKHRNAPPEALAAMIAHEAMHDDAFNSTREEVQGWTREAEVWMEMKAKNPTLAKIPRGVYPLVDRENDIEQQYRKGTLAAFVRSNQGYQGLPETSPGFEAVPTTATNPEPVQPN